MSTFQNAVHWILEQEGGLTDDPNDPGGLTKWGISQKAFPDVDIRQLTEEQAIGYYRVMWDASHLDEFPASVAFVVFDGIVNQGHSAAIRMLQMALGVKSDGVVGTQTVAASQAANLSEIVARRMHAGYRRAMNELWR